MKVKTLLTTMLSVVLILIACSVYAYAAVDYGSVTYYYPLSDATVTYTQNTQDTFCTATTSINRAGGSTYVNVLAVGEFDQTLSNGTVLHDTTTNFGYGGTGATATIYCPYNGKWTNVQSEHYAQYDGQRFSRTVYNP